MDNEKIILLIVGAIIGFLVSLAKDWLMEGKKQKEKEKHLKREQLEYLYILLSEYTEYSINLYSNLFVHLKSNENINDFKERFEKIDMKYKDNYKKIKVIFALYFHNDLEYEYKEMDKIQTSLSEHLIEYIEAIHDAKKEELGEKVKKDITRWNTFINKFEKKLPILVQKIY